MARVLVFIVIVLLQLSTCVLCQTVVDSSVCEKKGKHCPESGDASYETKCCSETDGGVQLLSCCNPLVGVYIGLGVSIPIIVCVIVTLVILYCCWVYRGRKRARQEAELQNLQRPSSRQDEQIGEQIGEPPPPYTEGNLPIYTPEDPYHISTSTTSDTSDHPSRHSSDRESCEESQQLLTDS